MGNADAKLSPLALRRVKRAVAAWLHQAFTEPERTVREQLNGGGAIAALEGRLCRYYGVSHCLLVNNATNGLLALALTLPERSEIITSSQSWGGTWAPFERVGHRFIFAGTRRDGNVCPRSVEAALTCRTRAVLAVDWQGRPHDTHTLRRLCDQHSLLYLADAAASFGKHRRGVPASSLADAWVISFGPNKPLPCGEGGAVLTRDRALYENLVGLTQHPSRYRHEVSLTGWTDRQPLNARIHPLAAVLANVLLK